MGSSPGAGSSLNNNNNAGNNNPVNHAKRRQDLPNLLESDDIDVMQEADFEVGCAFREQLIPHALEW